MKFFKSKFYKFINLMLIIGCPILILYLKIQYLPGDNLSFKDDVVGAFLYGWAVYGGAAIWILMVVDSMFFEDVKSFSRTLFVIFFVYIGALYYFFSIVFKRK